MKTDIEIEKSKPIDEPVFLPDECGDSMWDTVLEQPGNEGAISNVALTMPGGLL